MEITNDFFFKKKVIIHQHRKGYRFSIDAPLLADFLPSLPEGSALEVGPGCGIISMLALYKRKFSRIYALEIQESLYHLARLNAEKNGFTPNFQLSLGDFNEKYNDFQGIRLIFSNPPYFQINRGRLSPVPEIRDAKAETTLTLRQLVKHAYKILGRHGSFCLILPFNRSEEVLKMARYYGFSLFRSRKVFSFVDGKPERFLVQLTNYDVSAVELEPLIIFKEKGVYSEEMDKILTG